MLLLYAVMKIPLLALSYKSGFIGGPIFPVLFSCTMLGLALSLVFPSGPVAIFVMCIEAAAFALALGVPLTAIILIIVMSNPSPELIVLIVISAATGLVLGALMEQMKARRIKNQATPVACTSPYLIPFFQDNDGGEQSHASRKRRILSRNGLDMLKKDRKRQDTIPLRVQNF